MQGMVVLSPVLAQKIAAAAASRQEAIISDEKLRKEMKIVVVRGEHWKYDGTGEPRQLLLRAG